MMHTFFSKSGLKRNKGYTLLFAVLVSSVVLAIGISILNISKKEFLLASSARESTTAFYAADSGLECAMFWDKTVGLATSMNSDITCGASTGALGHVSVQFTINPDPATSLNPATAIFHIKLNDNACAIVQIDKYYDDSNVTLGNVPWNRISSRGYNIGWNEATQLCTPASPSPRRVERALRFTY